MTTNRLRLLVPSMMPLHGLIIIDRLVNAILFLPLIWPYTMTVIRPRTVRIWTPYRNGPDGLVLAPGIDVCCWYDD